jgi:hypothetical protein
VSYNNNEELSFSRKKDEIISFAGNWMKLVINHYVKQSKQGLER